MDAVLHGLLLGFLLSLFIGATFFILIETSIHRGFKPALIMNLGVFLSDISILLIAYFGADYLNNFVKNSYFQIFGGIAFLGFGNYYLFKKYKTHQVNVNNQVSFVRLFFNGFIVNTLNPSVIAFWLGAIVLAVSHHRFTPAQTLVFFVSCFSFVIVFDITKVFFASKLKGILNVKSTKIIGIITGIIFIVLGLKLVLYNYL